MNELTLEWLTGEVPPGTWRLPLVLSDYMVLAVKDGKVYTLRTTFDDVDFVSHDETVLGYGLTNTFSNDSEGKILILKAAFQAGARLYAVPNDFVRQALLDLCKNKEASDDAGACPDKP